MTRSTEPRRRAGWAVAALLALAALAAAPAFAGPVEETLAEELRVSLGAAVPADAEVSLTLGRPFDGAVEAVRELSYDPRNGTFNALVSSAGRVVELSGQVAIEVAVPVAARRMRPGEIITAADLASIRMPMERLGGGFATEADQLIGLSPRRVMVAGRLVRLDAVGAPIVVQRNRPVTLVYEDGPLLLAARGRALQDGGVGDLVRVMNVASNAVVTGTITGAETVSVNGPRLPGAALAGAGSSTP